MDEEPYIEEAEWIFEFFDEAAKMWIRSAYHQRESNRVKPKTMTECIAFIQQINKSWKEGGSIRPDQYRLRQCKNKKDIIPASILIAMD